MGEIAKNPEHIHVDHFDAKSQRISKVNDRKDIVDMIYR